MNVLQEYCWQTPAALLLEQPQSGLKSPKQFRGQRSWVMPSDFNWAEQNREEHGTEQWHTDRQDPWASKSWAPPLAWWLPLQGERQWWVSVKSSVEQTLVFIPEYHVVRVFCVHTLAVHNKTCWAIVSPLPLYRNTFFLPFVCSRWISTSKQWAVAVTKQKWSVVCSSCLKISY